MTITVEELRRKYPNPDRRPAYGTYCVGFALCRELNMGSIVEALRVANPRLSFGDAWEIQEHIIAENDQGNFDVAWAWLDKGLSA